MPAKHTPKAPCRFEVKTGKLGCRWVCDCGLKGKWTPKRINAKRYGHDHVRYYKYKK